MDMDMDTKRARILNNYNKELGLYYYINQMDYLFNQTGGYYSDIHKKIEDSNLIDASKRYLSIQSALKKFMENICGIEQGERNAAGLIAAMIALSSDKIILPSIDTKRRFSYSRKDSDTDETRVASSLGRICRRQLGITPNYISDDVLGKIADFCTNEIWPSTQEVEVLTGYDIVNAYSDYIGYSCMRGGYSDYVKVYAINKDVVSLLAVFNDSRECVAKALLWKLQDGSLFLERAYCHEEHNEAVSAIVKKARDMGANVSINTSCSRRHEVTERTIKLSVKGMYQMPYFDTFVSVKEQVDKNTVILSSHGTEELTSTEGGGVSKCICGTYVVGSKSSCPICTRRMKAYSECASCGLLIDNDYLIYVRHIDGSVCEECIDNYPR